MYKYEMYARSARMARARQEMNGNAEHVASHSAARARVRACCLYLTTASSSLPEN